MTSRHWHMHINYLVQNDEECDRVSQAISRFCIEMLKILILEDKLLQVGPTTYERRQQIKGVAFHL
jgi:hypothetical protein